VTTVDWAALAFVAFTALLGFRKGMIASALSLTGVVVGALVGARLAPHLFSGGAASPWAPLAALAGAAFGAFLFEAFGSMAGRTARTALPLPPLRAIDSAGGLVLGAGVGLALVWVVGAGALLVPGQNELRRAAQRSTILTALYERVPPADFMRLLARVDPFPTIAGPAGPIDAPDPRLLRDPEVRRAAASVVRVLGTACGLRVTGSGWVARPNVVVTAAHVVAGEEDTEVETQRGDRVLSARVVAFDRRNDVAVLRVRSLGLRPLAAVKPQPGIAVVILGYPENGPLAAVAGRLGATTNVLSDDAYGHGPVPRQVTSVRGEIRHGNSGGPAVDSDGNAQATLFAARLGSSGGFGVPSSIVRKIVDRAGTAAVSTGDCAA
jgi:S1-C subfamily serine protease